MNSSILESFSSSANAIIDSCTIQGIRGSKNLKCLSLKKASFNNYKLSDLPIDKSTEIQFLDLSGTNGLKVLPNAQNVIGIYQSPVPFSWSELTKLSVINLRDAGLSASYVDNFIIGLSQVATAGLGSASLTKVIYLDGLNSNPTPISANALATLTTLGFTLYHSDPTKATELEPNPCCGSDCVECGGGVTPNPIIPIVLNIPETILSNAGSQTYSFNVQGVVIGGNNNIVPASILPSPDFDTIDIEAYVTANDTINVTITNDGGDNITVPSFNFNVFINP